jgi:hypothetical protein
MQNVTPQVTLHVEMHPTAREMPHGGYMDAEVNLDPIPVDRDLQPGDHLTVTVANADGEVIGTATQEIGAVGFKPMKLERKTIGQVRAHKAKTVIE